jgi:hypothetical protein
MKTNRFHLVMFAIVIVANVLWLEPFRHRSSVTSWTYLDRADIELDDFAEHARLRGPPMEKRYEFHWPPGQGPGFLLSIKEEVLNNSQHVVACLNLLLCFVWVAGAAISRIMSPRGQNNGRQPEPTAAPISRPPSQMPPSAEAKSPHSQRRSSSGGCG